MPIAEATISNGIAAFSAICSAVAAVAAWHAASATKLTAEQTRRASLSAFIFQWNERYGGADFQSALERLSEFRRANEPKFADKYRNEFLKKPHETLLPIGRQLPEPDPVYEKLSELVSGGSQ